MTLDEFRQAVETRGFDPARAFETTFDGDPIYQVQKDTAYLVYNLRRKKWIFKIFLAEAAATPEAAFRKTLEIHRKCL